MEQAAGDVPRVEKKGKGKMVGILVALVLVLSAGAAGAVFAPRLLTKDSAAKHPAGDGEAEEGAEGHEEAAEDAQDKPKEEADERSVKPSRRRAGPVGEVIELPPIVVDTRASDNSLRHIKVQIAVELPKALPVEEFKRLTPFAREAAISYLRTQEYDRLADPKVFEAIRKDIENEVIDAVGKQHARRVLIVDFVVQ